MNAFDKDYIQARIDAMKMTQTSLQQLMTLSAAGLALFFSFIGKAQFVTSIALVGIIVVWCWIISLCMAAVGHKLLGNMVIAINNLSSKIVEIKSLSEISDEIEEEMNNSVNPLAVAERAKEKLKNVEKEFDLTSKAFTEVFFSMQDKVSFLVKWSLATMVAGFIAIGAGYSIWVLNPPLTMP